MLTTTVEWGAVATKLDVPPEWKGLSLSLSLHVLHLALLIQFLCFAFGTSNPISVKTCRMADLSPATGIDFVIDCCILHVL